MSLPGRIMIDWPEMRINSEDVGHARSTEVATAGLISGDRQKVDRTQK